MTEVDLRPGTESDEQIPDSTPDEERDAKEVEELLKTLDSFDEDNLPTREEIDNLTKGVKNLASRIGRRQENPAPPKKEESPKSSKPKGNEDVNDLFFLQVPDAEIVTEDLQAVADAKYNGSVTRAWRNESWLQEKAQALLAAKKKKEEDQSKISPPSNGAPAPITEELPFDKVDLDNPDHVKFINADPERRKRYNDWMAKNFK